ncbi:MAG: SsrA-binding protein [Thermoproteota archaeon]|jgi:SsrA-binding protein
MSGIKVIIQNKRARYDFAISELFEAGLVLQGTEVKSIRNSTVKIAEAYIDINKKEEVFIHNMWIAHYEFGSHSNHVETRKRKLLLNKSEILKMKKEMALQNSTIVPVKLYFKGSRVKIEIGLAKGKKLYDKRGDQAKKDVERKLRQKNYDL